MFWLRLILPVALKPDVGRTIGGTFGPIVIVIDEGIPCVWIYIGNLVCVVCTFGATCI
jgi:hypothetical protein